MRDFERLTPFKGERGHWRTWSQKARCAARVAGLERVMLGKDPRPSSADGPDAVEAWDCQNRRIHTTLVMLMEGSAEGVIREDLEGNGVAAWKVLERRYGTLTEQQGEKLVEDIKQMKMKRGEDFDDFSLRMETIADEARRSGAHFPMQAQRRALVHSIPDRFETAKQLLVGQVKEYDEAKEELRSLILNNPEKAKFMCCSGTSCCTSSSSGHTSSASSSSDSDTEGEGEG